MRIDTECNKCGSNLEAVESGVDYLKDYIALLEGLKSKRDSIYATYADNKITAIRTTIKEMEL